jgi:hypothetical protein
MTASTVGDVIVLAGGCVGNQTVTDWGGYACDAITAETLIYSPKEDKYTVVADAPRPRYRHAAAVVGTKVYLLGGTNLDVDEYFNEIMVEAVDVFDTVTSKWTTLDQLHPAVTTDPAAFATGTKIVYTGGYVTTNNYNARCALWDRNLHSRMLLVTTCIPLSGLYFLTGSHCKFRPNTKGHQSHVGAGHGTVHHRCRVWFWVRPPQRLDQGC